MTTLIVGDVHGCADELDALLQQAGASRVVLVGDLFTKGPSPGRVWSMLAASGCDATLGNHDARLLRAAAGERPDDKGARRCIARLDAEDRGWRTWLASRPLTLEVAGWTVVHAGLHPSGALDKTTRKMALTMRRWPRGDPDAPFWWQIYTGDRRVAFGHDARRGLVRVAREGAPWLVGLDTGCVYGGALSGYLVEADQVIEVPARRVYRPV